MRVVEIYKSIQGEGPNVGVPTIFIRFGGCNLRCPLWPCDTQYAIDPAYRNEWRNMGTQQIMEEVRRVAGSQKVNICLTGGEPFIQPKAELQNLVATLKKDMLVGTIECFSNGTIKYPSWAINNIQFVMDWKLPGSGEDPFNETRIENLFALTYPNNPHAIKFVCSDEDDFFCALNVYNDYVDDSIQVFFGVAWGKMTDASLIEKVNDAGLPWRLNVQVHNYIYDRNKRGI